MKKLLLLFFLLPFFVQAQTANSAAGNVAAASASCLSTNCVQLRFYPNTIFATITVSGTFSATTQFEVSGDYGVTWVAAPGTTTSTTSAGSTQFSVGGFTNMRARVSTYVSGTVSLTIIGSTQSVTTSTIINQGGGSSSFPSNSIPGTAGINAVPVSSGLMAEYRMLATETPASLVDYSGNGNNATGTVGTSPAIIAGSGGVFFNRNGAISLPASLNSALTIILYMSVPWNPAQLGFPNGAPIYGSAGVVANSVGLVTVDSIHSGLASASTGPAFCCLLASVSGTTPTNISVSKTPPYGNVVIALAMDTADIIYTNGLAATGIVPSVGNNSNKIGGSTSNAGVMTTGNYQLGGHTTSLYGIQLYLLGSIYYAAFYNRVLTPTEIQQDTAYMQSTMAARGVQPYLFNNLAGQNDILALDGDSLTLGLGQSPGTPYSSFATFTPTSWRVLSNPSNGSSIGILASTTNAYGSITGAQLSLDPLYNPNATRNAIIAWFGTNDANVTAEGGVAGYCAARRKTGFKCFIVSVLSHTGSDAFKNTFDTWMRANWTSFADGFIDMGSDPLLGADGASVNTTWFITGGLHPTTQAIANFETPMVQRGIARYYGNVSFSQATVYGSAAAAAVATTAGTMSGNTATITFSATPANCQVGNQIVLTGITPAGYNSPTGHYWQILTRSATQITFYNSVAALGVITIQGTGVCTQQQDVDTYSTLNFGAGNFTLQSCMGYTGQNIYLQNINAVASTLVPFASETITGVGATPATLAANSTATLQSQLVSSAAAGCNWVRTQ